MQPTLSSTTIRAISFPWDSHKPTFAFVTAHTWPSDILDQELVLPSNSPRRMACLTIDTNHLTGRPLAASLKVVYRHWAFAESDRNKSITNGCFDTQGIPQPRLP